MTEKMSPADSGSEGENGEKPVRERLKQTTIDKTGQDAADTRQEEELKPLPEDHQEDKTMTGEIEHTNGKSTSRPARKRSFEDMGNLDTTTTVGSSHDDSASSHVRKRTREARESEAAAGLTEANGNPKEETKVKNVPKETEGGKSESSARALTPQPDKLSFSSYDGSSLTSPRKKRSRESLDPVDGGREQKIQSTEETKARRSSSEERRVKNTSKDEAAAINPSTQTDASKRAPVFGEILKPAPLEKKSDLPQTSSSAFAASGFASMSGSASAFGASSSCSSSSSSSKPGFSQSATASAFASPAKQTGTFTSSFAAPSSSLSSSVRPSAFGASLGKSSFGGGFGGGFGSGAKLSTFAAPVGDAKLESTPKTKRFGASEDDAEEEGEDESEATSAAGEDADTEAATPKEDESNATKFKVVQDVQTGEDDELTKFVNRGRLFQYHADLKAWKERGVGPFKVNVQHPDDTGPEANGDLEAQTESDSASHNNAKARFVMRNHATHKLILNAPIFKDMSLKERSAKELIFACPSETGELTTYIIKMGREEDIKDLSKIVQGLQNQM